MNAVKGETWPGWHQVMTPVPAEIHDRADERRKQSRAYEEWALERLRKRSSQLTRGTRDFSTDTKGVRDILTFVAPRRGMAARQAVADWLARGFARGRAELDWKVPPPPEILQLPHERSLVSESGWLAEPLFCSLEQAFVENIAEGLALTELEEAGRFVHSAIACGGLWSAEKRRGFEESRVSHWRCDGLRVYLSSEYLAVKEDESEPKDNKIDEGQDNRVWRWQADAITGRLISRYVAHRDYGAVLLPAPAVMCLRAFWKKLAIKKTEQPRSLAEFVRMAVTHWTPFLPPFLLDIASGRCPTADVPGAVLARLRTGEPVKHVPITATPGLPLVAAALSPVTASDPTYTGLRERFTVVNNAAKALLKLGRKPAREAIRSTLEQVVREAGSALSVIELLMLGWLHDLAINGGLRAGKLTARSLRRYFGAARYAILGAFQDDDLRTLDAIGWLSRLQQAIDRAHDHQTPRQVLSFAHYVLRLPDGPRFDLDELEVEGNSVRVRATLVTPDELERALQRLRGDERLVLMQKLASVLLFYCGLRPDDLVNLRLQNIHGLAVPEILVRPNRTYDPKTQNAVRRVPVMTQLPQTWAELFSTWVRRRMAEAGCEDSGELLFSMPGESHKTLTTELLQNPITAALREETGDQSLTFYTLRHGFGTVTLLRLLAADVPRILPRGYAVFAQECFQPASSRALKAALGAGTEAVADSGLRMTASLMGHLNSRTTRLHYIHLMDVVLAQTFDLTVGKRLPEALFKALADKGSYWYEHRKRLWIESETAWDLEELARLWLRDTRITSESHTRHRPRRVPKAAEASTNALRLPYGLLPSVLRQLFDLKRRPEEVANHLGLSPPVVRRVRTRALALCGVAVDGDEALYETTLPKRNHLIPSVPRSHRDQDDVRKILEAVEKRPLKRKIVAWLIEQEKNGDPGNIMTARFSDAGALCRLMAVYEQLGVPRKRLFLMLDPHQDASAADITLRKEYWSKASKIPPDRIKVEARSSRWWQSTPQDAPYGYVMLYVMAQESQPDPKTGEAPLARSYGVRYAMHLILLNEPA